MNRIRKLIAFAVVAFAGLAHAQSGDMKGMEMPKNQGATRAKQSQGKATATHQADGEVKAVDREKGKVTLAHGPVATLKWPAMTMAFSVRDKSMLDMLPVGQKVHVEFVQQGADYVITSVK
jgi:Cu(I)/Ag(I) efflux system protein CusF